jgi:hypothetical protein
MPELTICFLQSLQFRLPDVTAVLDPLTLHNQQYLVSDWHFNHSTNPMLNTPQMQDDLPFLVLFATNQRQQVCMNCMSTYHLHYLLSQN